MGKFAAQLQHLFCLVCHPSTLAVISLAGVFAANRAEHEWLVGALLAGGGGGPCRTFSFLVSGRAAFSVYLAWMGIAFVTVVSAIKFRMKGFSLHFYDVVFVSRDPEVYRFLLGSYLH